MTKIAKSLVPAFFALAALGAQAADGNSQYLGQNEAGPIENPAWVAPANAATGPSQYIGQNEAGPIENPAFVAGSRSRAEVQREAARPIALDSRYVG